MDGRRVCSVQQLRNESGGDSTGSWWYREEEGRPAGIYSLYRYIFTDRFHPPRPPHLTQHEPPSHLAMGYSYSILSPPSCYHLKYCTCLGMVHIRYDFVLSTILTQPSRLLFSFLSPPSQYSKTCFFKKDCLITERRSDTQGMQTHEASE